MPNTPNNNAALEAFGWINSAISNLAESVHAARQSGALTESEDARLLAASEEASRPLAELESQIAAIRNRLMT